VHGLEFDMTGLLGHIYAAECEVMPSKNTNIGKGGGLLEVRGLVIILKLISG
jgi:hypothetical protein